MCLLSIIFSRAAYNLLLTGLLSRRFADYTIIYLLIKLGRLFLYIKFLHLFRSSYEN